MVRRAAGGAAGDAGVCVGVPMECTLVLAWGYEGRIACRVMNRSSLWRFHLNVGRVRGRMLSERRLREDY